MSFNPGAVQQKLNIAQLRSNSASAPAFFVSSYRSSNGAPDGGGGLYTYDASDTTSSDNGGTIIVDSIGQRWKLDNDGVLSIRQFGAYGDGVHSDDTAMANWLAALTPTVTGFAPGGTYNFTSGKTLPLLNGISIVGTGSGQTIFQYTGTATNIDLWVVGDGVNSYTGWSLTGFTINSSTVMTSGAALRLRRMQNGNQMHDVAAGSLSQPAKNLWNGIWLDNVNVFKYIGFIIQVQNEGLMMNGGPSGDEGSDIYLDDGTITFCSVGFHVGGGQGGVYFDKVLAFGNGTNYLVDNALAARRNREIFWGDLSISDACVNYGIYINDPLTASAPVVLNAFVGSAGLAGSGGSGINVYVKSWPNGRITIGPGQLFNATSDGLRVDDSTCVISIDSARHIFNNGGYGVNATVATTNIHNSASYMASNVLGNQSANVKNPPWLSYATTVTTTSGAITTLGAVTFQYILSGGVCTFTVGITITTNGTGAGSINSTLPKTASGYATVYGKELLIGKALTGVSFGSNFVSVTNYDASYPGGDGHVLVVSGSYNYV